MSEATPKASFTAPPLGEHFSLPPTCTLQDALMTKLVEVLAELRGADAQEEVSVPGGQF